MALVRSFAHCESALPCPPGESRFHIKGEFYRQMAETLEHFDRKTDGKLRAALARDGLGTFAWQKFLASAFYDVLPLPRLAMTLARVLNRDVREMTSRMGKNAIERSMKGVYSSLFTTLTTENFTHRFAGIIPHLYNFGPVTLTADADGRGSKMVRSEMPLVILEWWCLVTVPFVEVPLIANGGKDLTIAWKIQARGTRDQIPLGDAIWTLRWR